MQTNYRGKDANKIRPKKTTKYIYYWETNHYLKRHCQVFQDNLNSNRIYLGDEDNVYLGASKPRVRPIYMRQEKSGRESVADVKKLRYPSLSPANIQMLKIGKLKPNSYFSDKEIKYISLDIPIDGIEVLTACTNQSQPTKELSKEFVKRILHQCIEKKKEYATPKNIWLGE